MTHEELLRRISIDPAVCGGKPCIRGHRICVSLILDFLASGVSAEEILKESPPLRMEDIQACMAYSSEMTRERTVVQEKREVAERYGVPGTPAAVLIRPDGMLASRVATGADGVRQLLQAALSLTPQPQAAGAGGNGRAGISQAPKADVATGQLVPPITLRDLDGAEVDLADWLEQETVLLFWSPSCGFCQRVLPELRGWERQRPAGAPRLLLISTGAAEANRAMELASPVLLDDAFHTGRLFGAAGTPSAVLIDREGKVASGVAVGGPAVLVLAGIKEARNEPTF